VLGAPEYATDMLNKNMQQIIEDNSKLGFRCLLLCKNGATAEDIEEIPTRNTPIAIIVIEDNIKLGGMEFIEPFNISTIFGNLLDNAIEACRIIF